MALISIGTLPISRCGWQLIRADKALEMMDGGTRIVKTNSAQWMASITLAPKRLDQARAIQAALAQLSNLSNTFQLTPPGWVNSYNYSTTPQVDGAGQLGNTLNLKSLGWNVSVCKAGDFFSVNGEMKMCTTANFVADGSGNGAISFEPALRASPANNASLNFTTPKVTMRLMQPVAAWAVELGNFHTITFEAIEMF
jgi:hypothetical protein